MVTEIQQIHQNRPKFHQENWATLKN